MPYSCLTNVITRVKKMWQRNSDYNTQKLSHIKKTYMLSLGI